MNAFSKTVEIRWSDLDPNFHLRHSVYYDYGASARIEFLQQQGITTSFLQENAFGPILFREECIFKREIRSLDIVTIDLQLLTATADYSRWSIIHNIIKNGDTIAAVLTVEGAWIDVVKRKLATPPSLVLETFNKMPRHESFTWTERKQS